MSPHYDFSEPIAEEVLSDLADNFFSSRKELDDLTDIFQSYIGIFREKERTVSETAGFLNWLLINRSTGAAFYECLGMNSPTLLLAAESRLPDESIMPEKIPFAFTKKGEFVKIVLRAYNALQKASDEYMNGSPASSDSDVYYKMLLKMAMLINEKIRNINNSLSPYTVLDFARRFNAEAQGKERITGGTLDGYAVSIDSKLACQPIDFDRLQIKSYPELPEQNTVISEITAFCKKNYPDKKKEIRKRISDLKTRIRIASRLNHDGELPESDMPENLNTDRDCKKT